MKTLMFPLLLAGMLHGQQALSLQEAVRIATSKNASIASAQAGQDVAATKMVEARSGMLPKVNYSESFSRSDNPVFVFSSLLTQRQFAENNFGIGTLNRPQFLNNFQSRVTAEQPLYDAGKTRRAVESAGLAKDLSAEELRRVRAEVAANVVRLYQDAKLLEAQVDVAGAAMKSAEASLQQAEARVASGVATEIDVLSIRVHLAEVREEQIRWASNLEVAHAAINEAMGMPLETAHTLTSPLLPLVIPDAAIAKREGEALASRAEFRQAKLATALANVQIAEARSNFLPQVGVQGAFEADRQNFYNRGGANWLVAVGLRWNLFNGFADKAKQEASVAFQRQAAAEQSRAETGIRLQVRRAFAELQSAQLRIASAKATVQQAEESLRISRDRYAAGLGTVTDLLRTETALRQAQTRQLAAVHDQRIAAAMLELAAGTLGPDSEVLR